MQFGYCLHGRQQPNTAAPACAVQAGAAVFFYLGVVYSVVHGRKYPETSAMSCAVPEDWL
ncbi:hypothetical protein AHiyo8_55530 [Arthrobacter sp. Hiyo8]|nr:hypothetical protein AHiyo8_55530 [Arthrobacter sp. Hiyo8]